MLFPSGICAQQPSAGFVLPTIVKSNICLRAFAQQPTAGFLSPAYEAYAEAPFLIITDALLELNPYDDIIIASLRLAEGIIQYTHSCVFSK